MVSNRLPRLTQQGSSTTTITMFVATMQTMDAYQSSDVKLEKWALLLYAWDIHVRAGMGGDRGVSPY